MRESKLKQVQRSYPSPILTSNANSAKRASFLMSSNRKSETRSGFRISSPLNPTSLDFRKASENGNLLGGEALRSVRVRPGAAEVGRQCRRSRASDKKHGL